MVSLLFCGDFAPVKGFENLVIEKGSLIFGDLLEPINEVDVSFINLEAPACNVNEPIFKSGPALKINPACLESLSETGFDVIGLANNHILDHGQAGLIETIENCHKHNLSYVGVGKNIKKAQEPIILERKGIKIGLIAVTEHEFSIASELSAGAAPLDPIDNTYQIEKAQNNADFVFVTIHGGNEYFPYPRPGLRKVCQYFIDRGVDGVICNHPHVAGAYEFYKDKPIFYSLGNIIFDVIFDQPNLLEGWCHGYAVQLNFNNENKKLISFNIIPYRQSVADKGVKILEGEEKERFIQKTEDFKLIMDDEVEYKREWDKFCANAEKNMLNLYFLPSNIIFVAFSKFLPLKRLFLSKNSVTKKLNLIRCESHLELLQSILEKMYREYLK